MKSLRQNFYNIAGMPGVRGCIDCTHKRIFIFLHTSHWVYCKFVTIMISEFILDLYSVKKI